MNAMNPDGSPGISVVVSRDGVSKIPATGPAAAALRTRTPTELNTQLSVLMQDAGLNIRTIDTMAKRKNMVGLSRSTVQRYLNGTKRDQLFPNQQMLINFVTLCGASPAEIMCFVEAWKNLRNGCLPELPAAAVQPAAVPAVAAEMAEVARETVHVVTRRVPRAQEPDHPVIDVLGAPAPDDRVLEEYRFKLTESRVQTVIGLSLGFSTVVGTVAAGAVWTAVFLARQHTKTAYTGAAIAGLLVGPLFSAVAEKRLPDPVKAATDVVKSQQTRVSEALSALKRELEKAVTDGKQ